MIETIVFGGLGILILSVLVTLMVFCIFCLFDCIFNGEPVKWITQVASKKKKVNYLLKLVGRKTYKKFLESDDQVSHAYNFLLNVYPKYFDSKCLREPEDEDDIQIIAKVILEEESSKKITKTWI